MTDSAAVQPRNPTAAILIVGDEILAGQTHDVNLYFLAQSLQALGIVVRECRVIPDDIPTIVRTVRALRDGVDMVFSTGGIGPTHDDRTAEAMAAAFDVPLVQNTEAEQRLRDYYGDRITATRLRMARIPEGATLIDNPVSAAPGFCLGNVYVMAGVPSIVRAMFATLEPRLERGAPLYAVSVKADIGESLLAEPLAQLQAAFPSVVMGSYPYFSQKNTASGPNPSEYVPAGHGVALVARSPEYDRLCLVVEQLEALFRRLDREPITEWIRSRS